MEQLNTLAFAQFLFSVKVYHQNELMCLEQDFVVFEENGRLPEKVFVAEKDVNPYLT